MVSILLHATYKIIIYVRDMEILLLFTDKHKLDALPRMSLMKLLISLIPLLQLLFLCMISIGGRYWAKRLSAKMVSIRLYTWVNVMNR